MFLQKVALWVSVDLKSSIDVISKNSQNYNLININCSRIGHIWCSFVGHHLCELFRILDVGCEQYRKWVGAYAMSGVYRLHTAWGAGETFPVYCEMQPNRGWLVIQRRESGLEVCPCGNCGCASSCAPSGLVAGTSRYSSPYESFSLSSVIEVQQRERAMGSRRPISWRFLGSALQPGTLLKFLLHWQSWMSLLNQSESSCGLPWIF